MSNSANQCPKCKNFIFGYYCHNCKKDIRELSNEELIPDFLKDLLGQGDKNE